MAKRASPPRPQPQSDLPPDHDRENRQPYAKEAEDYGRAVTTLPEEQTGRGSNSKTAKAPIKK